MEYSVKKLSIIVPVYNVEKYLERCICSLLDQDISPDEYEIIMVNDGSTDKSGIIAEQLQQSNTNVILLTQNNQGLSEARNTGLKNAKGQYIMFVDSDDKLFPNVLGTLLSIAINNKLDACAYRMMYEDSNGDFHTGAVQPFSPDIVYSGEHALLNGADIGSACILLYSTRMLNNKNLRFLAGVYHEDIDFNLRMYAYVDRIMFSNVYAYSYTYNSTSINRNNSLSKKIKSIRDEFLIIRHLLDFAGTDTNGAKLYSFYQKFGNSIIISNLLNLIKSAELTFKEKKDLVDLLITLKLYPIHGRSKSWKTSLLIPILNKGYLLRFLLLSRSLM